MTTAFDRPCTTCGAKPGEWCTDGNKRREHHRARLSNGVRAAFSGARHEDASRLRGAARRGNQARRKK